MKHSMASLLIGGDSNFSSDACIGERLHLTMSACSFHVQFVTLPVVLGRALCRKVSLLHRDVTIYLGFLMTDLFTKVCRS